MTRKNNENREIKIHPNTNPFTQGSAIIECGLTKVHVTAMVEENVPGFMKGKGRGWVTAEYAMLPGSSPFRVRRDRNGVSGRSQEIQRLIGRSLRACIDLEKLGERTINIDCDVLLADGGTRTTSITGAYVALSLAIKNLQERGLISENPLVEQIAAISVGIDKNSNVICDLNYEQDSSCETDMNIVMTNSGKFIEIQGTAEGAPFSPSELNQMMEVAKGALEKIFILQNEAIKS
jgi:ribonuclease PH